MAARSSPAQAAQLLGQAGEAYRAALQREEDALTWSNLADALVQVGGCASAGSQLGDCSSSGLGSKAASAGKPATCCC